MKILSFIAACRQAVVTGFLAAVCVTPARADKLVLFAGGGQETENVPAAKAKLIQPFGIDFDQDGNAFICELAGDRVLKVDPKGMLTIAAGMGKKGNTGDDGPARQATFNAMHALAINKAGTVFLADTLNHRVRTLDAKTGKIRAFAGKEKGYAGDGGPFAEAKFSGIYCIGLSPDQARLVVTDLDNRRVRVLEFKSGNVELLAGNGQKGIPEDGAVAKTSPLVDPRAAIMDAKGNLYVLERSGHALRVIDPQGKIRTVVGTGKVGRDLAGGAARKAQLNGPKHLCLDVDGTVIVADTGNHRILRYVPGKETVELIAGTGKKGMSGAGGEALKTSFDEPHGVLARREGDRNVLYIVDSYNHRVFRMERE